MAEEKSVTVFFVIFDLRRKLALWVLNKEEPVMNEDGTVKFIKPERWGSPGGQRELGEEYIDAGQREVSEETGLQVKPDQYGLRLEEERDDHMVIAFSSSCFSGELRKGKEIKELKWFSVYNPPKNVYATHLRRYWAFVRSLKERGALR